MGLLDGILGAVLAGQSGGSDFCRCIKLAKQRASYAAIRLGFGQLWQSGYYDRIVRQDDDLQKYVDYILQNPVRAGLVKRASDYPFASVHIPRGPDL